MLLTLGAQFLGVATIVVYAGAILVMFLFVLMLAQPSGMAPYDRVTNEPMLAASAGAVLLGLLSMSIGRLSAIDPPSCCRTPSRAQAIAGDTPTPPAPATPADGDEVARLGAELFGRHLFSVEVAGILLLVALVGAIAVVSRGEASAEPGREAA